MTFARETVRRLARAEDQLDRLKTMEASPTIGELFGMFLGLPFLRGYWPMSSFSVGVVYDLSAQARNLSVNGGAAPNVYNSIIPYISLDGSGDYLSRADEAGLDITNGITFGGWFWWDTSAVDQWLMHKYTTTGNQRSYRLLVNSAGQITLSISADGTTATSVTSTNSVADGTWAFCVARFIPSTSMTVWLNGTPTTNTTSIPASIFSSTSLFYLGGPAGVELDGRLGPAFLCAESLGDTLIQYLYNRSALFFQ